MRLCDLRDKQVINENDCTIIGTVFDIEFDKCTGCIEAVVIPGPARMCGFLGRDYEYIIPFKCIKSIGTDIILVNVCLEKVKCPI